MKAMQIRLLLISPVTLQSLVFLSLPMEAEVPTWGRRGRQLALGTMMLPRVFRESAVADAGPLGHDLR